MQKFFYANELVVKALYLKKSSSSHSNQRFQIIWKFYFRNSTSCSDVNFNESRTNGKESKLINFPPTFFSLRIFVNTKLFLSYVLFFSVKVSLLGLFFSYQKIYLEFCRRISCKTRRAKKCRAISCGLRIAHVSISGYFQR
jgi:hypothetical protein